MTVSLAEPEAMGEAARAVAGAPLLKIKLDAEQVEERLLAVVRAAPAARLILDPNESWTIDVLRDAAPLIARLNVALIEQPLAAGADEALDDFNPPAPICADESVHVAADLPALVGRYQAVNIKLDKAGGLTEAARMLAEARRLGFGVMTGCMVCSSLGIAPALPLGIASDFADLDGPWWLAGDWPDGAAVEAGRLTPPAPGFWGR